MRSHKLGFLAITIASTAWLAAPARADLRVANPAGDAMTRSADEPSADNRNLFGDIGNFFSHTVPHGLEQGAHAVEHAGSAAVHAVEQGADKVIHGKWGNAVSESGQQLGHGHVGQALGTLGHAAEQTDYVQVMEKAGKHIYHGEIPQAGIELGIGVVNSTKYVTRPNMAIDALQDMGVNVPNVKVPDLETGSEKLGGVLFREGADLPSLPPSADAR